MTKQQKNSVSFWKRSSAFANRHKVLSVFVLVILGLTIAQIVTSTIHHFEVNAERKQFMQTKADLDNLYAQIVKQVGQPSQHKSVDYCGYTSQEFGRGARSCTMERYLFYNGNSRDAANTIVYRANSVIPQITELSNGSSLSSLPQDSGLNYDELSSHKILLSGSDRFQCSVAYTSKGTGHLPIGSNVLNPYDPGTLISIGCVKSAKAEYFSLLGN